MEKLLKFEELETVDELDGEGILGVVVGSILGVVLYVGLAT